MARFLEEGYLVEPIFVPAFQKYAFKIYEVLEPRVPKVTEVGHVRFRESVYVESDDSLEDIMSKLNDKIKELKK